MCNEKFELIDDDYYAVEIAINTVRRLLNHPQITAQDVIGLGNALYALEQLPLVTPGSFCEFGIVHESGTEDFGQMQYISLKTPLVLVISP